MGDFFSLGRSLFTASFQTTIAAFGHIDVVINNAGIMNDRFWELEVDINLVSEYFPWNDSRESCNSIARNILYGESRRLTL